MEASQKPPSSATSPENFGSITLQRLFNIGLFSDINKSPGAVEALASIMGSREFKAGSNIITEGASGTEMFILVKGKASVFKKTPHGDEFKVALFEGEKNIAFGEGALIDGDARSATIKAETDCHCVYLEKKAFEKFSAAYPQWALPIYKRIAQSVMARMKRTNDDMLLLYNALVAEIRGT
jgi:CRP/FNR family transcriptional regulator, cyclic AMP receptor protein